MSTPEPRPISRRSILRGAAGAGALITIASATSAAAATSGNYTIRFDQPRRQTILGLGFEIQSDSIGSNNNGLPDSFSSVPYDLTPGERDRFYQQMLKGGRADRGFRYCRLGLGLYFRGTDPTGKHLQNRYPGQAELLADMISRSGIEGVAAEYWSPPPGFKSNNSFVAGKLASFTPAFLDELGDAMVGDLDYLTARGVPISMWGLQNEPSGIAAYSTCQYTPAEYVQTFKAVAPKIKAKYPNALIHSNSQGGWMDSLGQATVADPQALAAVDAWTFHRVGTQSTEQIPAGRYTAGALGKPVFNNEFEYLDNQTSDARTLNTAQSIMNWMTFQDAPTWFWLHALKPTTNVEADGYALGYWRPPTDTDFSHHPNIAPGHWDFIPRNWNAIAGFVQFMPWNSVRYHVDEPLLRYQLSPQWGYQDLPSPSRRIMAWKTPEGKPVFAITNSSSTPYTFTVDTQTAATFRGLRYGPSTNNLFISNKTGPQLTITVPPLSIEFWIRTP
ncbi:hypothetical protein [Streptomyces sp. BE303]|uniref:hypothetical protein n=1 Tax=Streptomyces sp. BE303 TaxID=3002528 RepID=UPI002E795394|nr:hypothetical protein [Streptomyces sp. BE303]MED7947338.1 hypothetical protein [Streptomyces sp. BE303]